MSRRTATVSAVLAAAVALGLMSAAARATAPGKNGRIAFVRYRLSDEPLWAEIWVIDPDGTGERKVSHAPRGYLDLAPDWAPDGSRIAFQRCAPNRGRCAIWSVKSDGSGEKMLSPSCGRSSCVDDTAPSYSPNGHELAFSRFDSATDSIVVADTNLAHPRRVFSFAHVRGAPSVTSPAWSPDGKRLAFVVTNENGTRFKPVKGIAIYVINVDGHGLRRLTSWKLRAGAGPDSIDWSPDGSRILLRTRPFTDTGAGGNLYTILTDGGGLRQLTHFRPLDRIPGALWTGSYSPDGSSICFATYHGAVEAGPASTLTDVFVMSADGTDVRPVTRAPNWDGDPDWGPG
jgi:TolB protein